MWLGVPRARVTPPFLAVFGFRAVSCDMNPRWNSQLRPANQIAYSALVSEVWSHWCEYDNMIV